MSLLDAITSRLDPAERAKRVDTPITEAFTTRPVHENTAKNFEDLNHKLSSIAKHIFERYYGVELPEDGAFMQMRVLLNNNNIDLRDYMDDCLRGTNGGLAKLLDEIKEAFIRQQTRAYVDAVIDELIGDRFNSEVIEELMTEYLQRFGRYLPFERRSLSLLMLNWRDVLMSHVHVIAQTRRHLGKV